MNTCVYDTQDKLRFGRSSVRQMSQNAKTNAGSDKKNNKVTIIVIVVLAVIVIALVGVVAFLLGRGGKEDSGGTSDTGQREIAGNTSRVVLDESTAQDVIDEMRKQVEEGMFECSMSTEWSFEDGNAESKDAYVANTANNTHPFYFDVVLDGSDEVIYSSPVLPVGSTLTNFKLDKPLEAGTYEAICKYVLLKDEESQEEISTANFIITITVRK